MNDTQPMKSINIGKKKVQRKLTNQVRVEVLVQYRDTMIGGLTRAIETGHRLIMGIEVEKIGLVMIIVELGNSNTMAEVVVVTSDVNIPNHQLVIHTNT